MPLQNFSSPLQDEVINVIVGFMKLFVTKLLIISLLAISLHGFGTDEKTVLPMPDMTQTQAVDMLLDYDQQPKTLTAACDICVVVHQYLVNEPIVATTNPTMRTNLLTVVALPPDQPFFDILHPPTI